MPKPKIFLTALFAITLLNVSIPGCAQNGFAPKGYAQKDDCRFCHAPGKVAADFSAIYANPKSHHPVGVKYPYESAASPDYNLPNGHGAGITFFDRNGNSQPDSDEIRLYGVRGAVIISCASCHREHGTAPLPARPSGDYYLRVNNAGSALCSTCHGK